MKKSTLPLLAPLFMLSICGIAIAAQDIGLQGCWRAQQIELTMPDKSLRNQNADCVSEYDASHARSRCYTATGIVESLTAYEVVAPGKLKVTPLDTITGKAKAPSGEVRYRIDGAWLLFERQFSPTTPANSTQPTNFRSVSIRVGATEKPDCQPYGDTGLRIGRTPKSSLAMSTPVGWKPWLVDPVVDSRLGSAVNASLFIGAFVPAPNSEPNQLVIVVDDVRSGPIPVQAAEFIAVKKRFASELGDARLSCDFPDRACALLRLPGGGLVYTELINLKGRVAIITGTIEQAKEDSVALIQKSVQVVVAQLRAENAK